VGLAQRDSFGGWLAIIPECQHRLASVDLGAQDAFDALLSAS
jgi:hypothetical protein